MKRSFLAILLAARILEAQPPAAPKGPPKPAPRLASGRVDFSGVWRPGDIFLIEDITLGLKKGDAIALTPAAEAIMQKHQSKDDPETNCLPTGVPRRGALSMEGCRERALHLFPVRRQHPQLQADLHGWPQAPRRDPSRRAWYGHSVGHWEDDKLIVDTVGFNDLFWFDFVGHPHTEKLHTIERYSRPDLNTMVEEVTIDDPGAYKAPFTIVSSHRLLPGDELMEYICQENNRDVHHLVGPAGRP